MINKPQIQITPEMLQLIARIDEFKGRWQALQHLAPEKLSALKKVATIESVGSSTRIEGAKLTDSEVKALLVDMNVKSFRSRDEQEVAGYADIMDNIFQSSKQIKFDENHIKQLHDILLKVSSKDVRHNGGYKKFPNHVEAFNSEGESSGIVFKTTPPLETPQQMHELIKWTQIALKEKELHPLLIIAIFVLYFLAIHPFQDGNGRLSQALTVLLLLQQDYVYVPYSSHESIIEQNKDQYYLALRRSQATLEKENPQFGDWVLFFLHTLEKQCANLEHKIQQERAIIEARLSNLAQKILDITKQRGKITISELMILTNENRNKLKRQLQLLVHQQRLQQHGTKKGAYYTLK